MIHKSGTKQKNKVNQRRTPEVKAGVKAIVKAGAIVSKSRNRLRSKDLIQNHNFNLFLITLLIIADQFIKLMFRQGRIKYSSKFLDLTLTKNTGALFGVMQNSSLLIGFASLIIIGLLIYYYEELADILEQKVISPMKIRLNKKLRLISLDLIISGLISNAFDRFILHYVTDFFCLSFWPCFNLADSLVVIGIILYLYSLIVYKKTTVGKG